MANEAPSPSMPSVPTERTGVELNDNDVLCGRGLGASQFIGNKRFRDLVDTRKKEYNAEYSYLEKAEIAEEVFMVIRSRGGRFLKMVGLDAEKTAGSVVKRGNWMETDIKSALEKCKQALREKEVPAHGGKAYRRKKKTNRSPKGNKSAECQSHVPLPPAAHLPAESNAAVESYSVRSMVIANEMCLLHQ